MDTLGLVALVALVALYCNGLASNSSHGTHHVINPSRPSPAFRTASDKSWVWRPGNEASKDMFSNAQTLHPPRFGNDSEKIADRPERDHDCCQGN